MGVNSLWDIVGPAARPVKLEALSRKKLAVDASIWIYQFLKAVRDKDGNKLGQLHIVGFFRRICKLLYFGILPVFVFDGGAPPLKRQVIQRRRERRQGNSDDAQTVAQKLLAVQLQRRMHKEKEAANGSAVYLEDLPVLHPEHPQKAPDESEQRFIRKDEYHLPELKHFKVARRDGRIMPESEFEEYAADASFDVVDGVPIDSVDPASAEFAELPMSTQYMILSHLRLRSRLRLGYTKDQLEQLFPDSRDFSRFQIQQVQKRNFYTQRLMNVSGMDKDTGNSTRRIAGDKDQRYALVKNDDGWTLALQEHDEANPILVDEEEDPVDEFSSLFIPQEKLRSKKVSTPKVYSSLNERANKAFAGQELNVVDLDSDDLEDVELDVEESKDEDRAIIESIYDQFKHEYEPSESEPPSVLNHPELEKLDSQQLHLAIEKSKADYNMLQLKLESSQPGVPPPAFDFGKSILFSAGEIAPKLEEKNENSLNHEKNTTQHDVVKHFRRGSNLDKEDSTVPMLSASNHQNMTLDESSVVLQKLQQNVKTADNSEQAKLENITEKKVQGNGTSPVASLEAIRGLGHDKLNLQNPAERAVTKKNGENEHDVKHSTVVSPNKEVNGSNVDKIQVVVEDNERPMKTPHDALVWAMPSWFSENVSQIERPHSQQDFVNRPLEAQNKDEDEEAGLIPWSEARELIENSESDSDVEIVQEVWTSKDPSNPEKTDFEPVINNSKEKKIEASEQKKDSSGSFTRKADHGTSKYPTESNGMQDSLLTRMESEHAKTADNIVDLSTNTIGETLLSEEESSQNTAEKKPKNEVLVYEVEENDEQELIKNLETEESQHEQFRAELGSQLSIPLNNSITDEQLLQEQLQKAKRDLDEVTETMIKDVQELLKRFGIPYITAPMEAEAQCAELYRLGLVDGIVTDDSDCFLFGGSRIYKNMFNQKQYVECYIAEDIEHKIGLDQNKLIELAMLLGSDYTEGIKGIGPVMAMEVLAEFKTLSNFKQWFDKHTKSAVSLEQPTALEKKLLTRIKSGKLFLPDGFPNAVVAAAYTNPEVDRDDSELKWGIPSLDQIRTFLMYNVQWSQARVDEVMVPLIRDMNRKRAEGTQATIGEFFPQEYISYKKTVGLGKRMKVAASKLSK